MGAASAGASTYLSSSQLWFGINGVSMEPGVDYRPAVTGAPVDLDQLWLLIDIDGDRWCTAVPALENGQTYTLLTTTGGMTGRLSNPQGRLEDGDVVRDVRPFGRGCIHSVAGFEIRYHETGPVQSVTATVVDSSPTPVTGMTLTADHGSIQTNQPVTFTATVQISSGAASGVVSITDAFPDNDALACPDRHVVVRAQVPAAVTCTTTFSGSDDQSLGWWTAPVRTTFTPDTPGVRGSDTVGGVSTYRAGTTTSVAPDGEHAASATVTPAFAGLFSPTGSVAFFADGAPIAGCASRPLSGSGSPSATCDLAALAPGDHDVTATYGGDPMFLGSDSIAQSVRVTPHDDPTPTPPALDPTRDVPVASGATPPVRPHARRAAHARRTRCRRRSRAHRAAQTARARRCTTIRARKHTRGAGGRAG